MSWVVWWVYQCLCSQRAKNCSKATLFRLQGGRAIPASNAVALTWVERGSEPFTKKHVVALEQLDSAASRGQDIMDVLPRRFSLPSTLQSSLDQFSFLHGRLL